MLARHVSDPIGPSSGAFIYKLYLQIWYVVIRVLLDTSSLYERNAWMCPVVRVLPHTKVCEYSLYKTLLMMDRWGPKHVELTYVLNEINSLKITLCILLDGIYIARWYTVPTISCSIVCQKISPVCQKDSSFSCYPINIPSRFLILSYELFSQVDTYFLLYL